MSDPVDLALRHALESTGYLGERSGSPAGLAEGLRFPTDARSPQLEPAFSERAGLLANAAYETDEGIQFIVKGVRDDRGETVGTVRERAWNLGLAPLLWIVTPVEVRVYDAYRGVGGDEAREPLGTYRIDVPADMEALDAACGRFSVDTGSFWTSGIAKGIDRRTKVDQVLLEEIRALEEELVAVSAPGQDPDSKAAARNHCQELVTCVLFASYLTDRGLARPLLPGDLSPDLAQNFSSRDRALSLFSWLHREFNGDVFPEGIGGGLLDGHLPLLADFVRGTHLAKRKKGQAQLFPFRFDTLPIEMIGSVYEAFARRAAADMSKKLGLHYTPRALVHMALDPVFEGLRPDARILDPTCGSGLFLVESLRRLVWKRCGDGPRPRSVIRSILYRQVHGIDVQRAALRIAAFSLYLAALELETTCGPGEPIRFENLIGLSLHEMDFLSADALALAANLGVDAVVGNPPWTHGALVRGDADGTRAGDRPGDNRVRNPRSPGSRGPGASARLVADMFGPVSDDLPPADREDWDEDVAARRSPDQMFFLKALRLVGGEGRMAMYLKAAPILSSSAEASAFRKSLLGRVRRLALLNLSPLRHAGLFPGASSPGMLVCTNCGNLPDDGTVLVGTFPLTSDFERNGMLALSSADVREVGKDRLAATPGILKAAVLGTHRDMLLMERLERGLGTLGALLDGAGAYHGRGYQRKGDGRLTRIPEDILHLPALEFSEYRPLDLDGAAMPSLAQRGYQALFRVRDRALYRAPLLVFPKARHQDALEEGRTSAALSGRDIAVSENFYAVSFAGGDRRLGTILCALLNANIAAYQFLFGLGALGTERPSVSLDDFRGLRVPSFTVTDALAEEAGTALARAFDRDMAGVDAFASRLYGLAPHERALVADGVLRGRSSFLDTVAARAEDAEAPDADRLVLYAAAACRTVNAVLKASGERHLVADVAGPARGGPDFLDTYAAVRFSVRQGRAKGEPVRRMDPRKAASLFEDLREQLVRT
ncbi:MAG: N-6 DNA methylase, partial [Actinomycetospora chiangmaiensis]|nr:N-6 DNA methylase [Actinomycetospora chiangmaiensis]